MRFAAVVAPNDPPGQVRRGGKLGLDYLDPFGLFMCKTSKNGIVSRFLLLEGESLMTDQFGIEHPKLPRDSPANSSCLLANQVQNTSIFPGTWAQRQ